MRVVFLLVLLSSQLVLGVDTQWNWQCQTPGVGGLCALVCNSGCFEGPSGYPGGCGFCKFCTPDLVMESPECVESGKARSDTGIFDSRLVEGQPGWIENSQIVVHDVNSWFESGQGVQMLPAVMTGLQCAKACQSVQGCNSWSFCWHQDGCGEPGECSSVKVANASNDSCLDTMGMYPRCTRNEGRFGPMACILHNVNISNAIQISASKVGWTSGIIQNDTENPLEDFHVNLTCTI